MLKFSIIENDLNIPVLIFVPESKFCNSKNCYAVVNKFMSNWRQIRMFMYTQVNVDNYGRCVLTFPIKSGPLWLLFSSKYCVFSWFFFKIGSFQINFTGLNLCANGNHNCEQICVSTATNYYCQCHSGYLLNEDQKTCAGTSRTICSIWYLLFFNQVCYVCYGLE